MHERNIHTEAAFAGMRVTGLEYRTILLHCESAFFFFFFLFFGFFFLGKKVEVVIPCHYNPQEF